MNMATSMIDLSILYGAMNAIFAVCINRNIQLVKMVIAVLFACWVQLKERRYRSITGLVDSI